MTFIVHEFRRALEKSTIPVLPMQKYEREEMGRVTVQSGDVKLNPQERYTEAVRILRVVAKLPIYEQAVVVAQAGDKPMLEGAILVLLDVVERDALGDGPAKEAIRYWANGKGLSVRKLSAEYGGGKTIHHEYRMRVADELDKLLMRAAAYCLCVE